ncbi:SMI1/KNR4 family protein [Gordonia spumicola]|uniref:SMI1/KNR4 family protein n=1 Tax=Gordonia spumicola TaxID=589161 RepID=A0A7I9VBC0_9ACTN|nr:SMI1/KNR4 family protein [Gordonia spumicola]GEE02431.1 SMI1/KNR4 family protein [Gordonia spumicola]
MTVDAYLAGVTARLAEIDLDEAVDARDSLRHATGATATDLERLRAVYPARPDALVELLSRIDGTYWRRYGDHEVSVLILGSDVGDYPYYLQSTAQIVDAADNGYSIRDVYGDQLDEWLPEGRGADPRHGYRDDRIDPDLPMGRRLHFADCMNNGGTSQLYIDFDPLPGGTVGQVVRYLHDPDSYLVIADSFEAYLRAQIDGDFAFLGYYAEE